VGSVQVWELQQVGASTTHYPLWQGEWSNAGWGRGCEHGVDRCSPLRAAMQEGMFLVNGHHCAGVCATVYMKPEDPWMCRVVHATIGALVSRFGSCSTLVTLPCVPGSAVPLHYTHIQHRVTSELPPG
jgi:hypothetical protein